MENSTLYLPGFTQCLGRRRSAVEATQLRERSTKFNGLAALVTRFIPVVGFALKSGQRERVFTPWVTFIAFLGQVLSRGSACREAVRGVQAWRVASKLVPPDDKTSAYCQARSRLPLKRLCAAHEQIGGWIERHTKEVWHWCGRPVKVLDGSGLSMPDTDENRARWPYAGNQKPGCGFPTVSVRSATS